MFDATHSDQAYDETARLYPDDGTFTCDDAIEWMKFGRFQLKLVFICGAVWMADAMEMMLLSFLSVTVRCEWGLTSEEEALLTTIVFIGMFIGSYVLGAASDIWGRRKILMVSVILTFCFGAGSAFAPNYASLMGLRAGVGFGVGGCHVAFTLFAEFLPNSQRARWLLLIEFFWAFGSLAEAGLSLWLLRVEDGEIVLPWGWVPGMVPYAWRWLLLFTAFPLLIILLAYPLIPESPRWLQVSGRTLEATQVLRKAATDNGTSLPPGTLRELGETRRGRVSHLLSPAYRRTTLLLWYIWFASALGYYGLVLLVTELFQQEDEGIRCPDTVDFFQRALSARVGTEECSLLTTADYVDALVTSVAEVPGILFTLLIIDRLGRKRTMAVVFSIAAVFCVVLYPCTGRTWETVFLFIMRGAMIGGFQAIYVYTPEVYPSSVRSTGLGTCTALARIGGMLTPWIAQVLMSVSDLIPLILYASVCLLAALAALALPLETSGMALPDSVDDVRQAHTSHRKGKVDAI